MEESSQLIVFLSKQLDEEERKLKEATENNCSDIEKEEIQNQINALKYWINTVVKH